MKWFALLICAAMILVQPIAAQEDDLPISEGYIFNFENEIIYPMGVRFKIILSRPPEGLRGVTLRVEANGLEPETFEVEWDEPISSSPSHTELAYVWTAPENAPLRLFSDEDIIFEWNSVDDAGLTARARDVVMFRDERVNWVQDEDPLGHLNLTASVDGPSARQIRQNVLLPYNLMSANAGSTPTFNILLYPADIDPSGCVMVRDEDTGEDVLAAVGPVSGEWIPCDPQRAAAIIAASGFELVQIDGAAGAQGALVRFLTPRFYEPLWGGADVPDWFLTGLTWFYQPASKTVLMLSVRDAARVDGLLPLDAMATEQTDTLYNAQSFAMVLYIADQIGVDGLFGLASAIPNAESFPAAYEAAMGRTLNALLPNLRQWVFTSQADSAFNYTPYLADTPTPLPSPTHTLVPPTATDTAQPTATVTVTPSVTGVLSPTTRTPPPTLTFTPAPATVTPRPAGSLSTPTPVPVNVLESPVNRVGVIAILLIVLAIIVLIYWLVSRRR
jgi:hypothetical protein